MANYASLKAAIQSVIKTNGNNEITGALLQQSILALIDSLGAGYQFIGIATPITNPGAPDQRVFYIAQMQDTSTTFTYFDNLPMSAHELAILRYDSGWTKESIGTVSGGSSLAPRVFHISDVNWNESTHVITGSMTDILAGTGETEASFVEKMTNGTYDSIQVVTRDNMSSKNMRLVAWDVQEGAFWSMAFGFPSSDGYVDNLVFYGSFSDTYYGDLRISDFG